VADGALDDNNDEDSFALSKSSWNPRQSANSGSSQRHRQSINSRADSLAFSQSAATDFFGSKALSKTNGSLRKSSLKRSGSQRRSNGVSLRQNGPVDDKVVDFQLTVESLGRSSLNYRDDS